MSESTDQSQSGTTTLHIAFAGLCLLVRDETEGGEKILHVLLPGGSAHAGHHAARLIFDPVYGCANPHSSGACHHKLDGVLLSFTDPLTFPGGITGGIKIDGVVDESCIGGTPVPRRHVDEVPPRQRVKARITLAAGHEGTLKGHGADWDLGPCGSRFMANWVHWVIPGVRLTAGALTLPMLVNGNPPREPLVLRPHEGKIMLFVFHSEEDDLPPGIPTLPLEPKQEVPSPGAEAEHFKAFYPLVGKPDSEPGPIYVGGAVPVREKGLDYMCIAATAPAESRQP